MGGEIILKLRNVKTIKKSSNIYVWGIIILLSYFPSWAHCTVYLKQTFNSIFTKLFHISGSEFSKIYFMSHLCKVDSVNPDKACN